MDLETIPLPFVEWLSEAVLVWLASVTAAGIAILIVSYFVAAARLGFLGGGDRVFSVLKEGVADLLLVSPRRVMALAWLAVQESLRRKALAGLIVYLVLLLFAAWFLRPDVPEPARLYISFILTATSYLVLLLALLLGAFSLPADIQNRTIFTIVTKPVRPSEIVLGRVLGFTAIGTALLAMMGVIGYFFVSGSLRHSHELAEGDLTELTNSAGLVIGKGGRTSEVRGHRHSVTLDIDGVGYTDLQRGHRHAVRAVVKDGQTRFEVGSPEDQFHARIPMYGKLRFKDRQGKDVPKGLDVGAEYRLRSYIEGGTQGKAIWRFSGLKRQDYPDGLNLELSIRVFRSHKGKVDQGVLGSLVLKNPQRELRSSPLNFYPSEFSTDSKHFALKPADPTDSTRTIDLFESLVENGELDVELTCLQRAQFFGMAEGDVYLLPRHGHFAMNFFKAYVSIWVQMVLITAFSVMWSTFLNGPVAMLATMATIVGGFYRTFIYELATGSVIGGGPFESWLRIVRQDSMVGELEPTLTNWVLTGMDKAARVPLYVASNMLPDLGSFDTSNYVALGFDIPLGLVASHLVTAAGFCLPVIVLGYLFFKIREVAK